MSFVSIPNTFTSGTLASSAKVNQNFAVLAGAITDGTKEIGCLSLYAASHLSAANLTVVSTASAANMSITSALTAANLYAANVSITSALTAGSMYAAGLTLSSSLTAVRLSVSSSITGVAVYCQTITNNTPASTLQISCTSGPVQVVAPAGTVLTLQGGEVDLQVTTYCGLDGIPEYGSNASAVADLGAKYIYRNGDNLCITH